MVTPEDIDSYIRGQRLSPEVELEIAQGVKDPASTIAQVSAEHVNAIFGILDQKPDAPSEVERRKIIMIMRASYAFDRAENFEQAIHTGKEAYERARELLGELHSDTLSFLSGLGRIYRRSKDLVSALKTFELLLELRSKVSETSTDVAYALGMLGNIHVEINNLQTAIFCHERAIKIIESVPGLGPDCLEVGTSLDDLGDAFIKNGDYEEAKKCFERALMIYHSFGEDIGNILESIKRVEELIAEDDANEEDMEDDLNGAA